MDPTFASTAFPPAEAISQVNLLQASDPVLLCQIPRSLALIPLVMPGTGWRSLRLSLREFVTPATPQFLAEAPSRMYRAHGRPI